MKNRHKIKLMICLFLWFSLVLCLGWTNTLKTNTPAGTDDPREADDRMREIKAAFVERLDVDHYFTASSTSTYDAADTGKHEFVTLIDMHTDPSQTSGYAHIYMKGDELFYQDDTDTTCQLTKDGFIEWESINDVNNATWIKSVDSAGTGTINLIQGDANNLAVLPDGCETATNAAPGCTKGVANKKYVDDQDATKQDTITVYDSDWFAVTTNTNYTKAHGLGAIPTIVQVWYSDTADGTGDVVLIGNNMYSGLDGLVVIDIDSTNVIIRGQTWVADYYNQAGTRNQDTSGYAKIKAILIP